MEGLGAKLLGLLMSFYRCIWCEKKFYQSKIHSIEECEGQKEWNDWLEILDENRIEII